MPPSHNRIAYYRDRCTPPLTQRTLARTLGVHANTVVNWEREGVPAAADLLRIVGVFVAHGALRDLATAEAFWASSIRIPIDPPPELSTLFASPPPQAPAAMPDPPGTAPWLVPYRRNPLFVGRTTELAVLTRHLSAGEDSVITGTGGMGKTQLACELAYQVRDRFPGGVFWISCANPDVIATAVARCGWASYLDLHPRFGDLSLHEQVELVLAAWRLPVARLLIFDTCEDEDVFARWRPGIGGSHVVVTSRRARWNATLGLSLVPLGTLERQDSVALLQRYTSQQHVTVPTLRALAHQVGDLPLALHIVGSRLHHTSAVDEEILLHARVVGQDNSGSLFSPTGHTASLAETFDASLVQLGALGTRPSLAQIVVACVACTAAGEPLGYDLLDRAVARAAPVATANERLAAREQAIMVGLVLDGGSHTVRMHRLVAEHVLQRFDERPVVQAVGQALLQRAEELLAVSDIAALLAIYPHLQTVAEWALRVEERLGARLYEVIGAWLIQHSAFAQALAALHTASRVWQANGDQPLDRARCSNVRGLAYQFSGEFAEAERCYVEAYTLWHAELGPDHLATAMAANNLGYLLFVRGERNRALAYLRVGLRVRQAQLPADHPEIARSLSNLGYLHFRHGQYAEARPLLEQALAMREQAYGATHPATAQSLNNLGELLMALGETAQARVIYERALAVREQMFGETHISTAESLRNIGDLLSQRGETDQARGYYQRAVAICTQCTGPMSLDTARALGSLGGLEEHTGAYTAAFACYQQVLQIYQRLLVADHPDLLAVHERIRVLRAVDGSLS